MAITPRVVATRVFAAEEANFVVHCPTPELRDVVESVFVDLSGGRPGVEPTRVALEIHADGQVVLTGDGLGHTPPQSADGAIASLVTAVSRLSLDADAERLHLHCAALSREGRGVLISAASGTGKTTFAAHLASDGWTYVSDEAVSLDRASSAARGFAKPLLLNAGGSDLVPFLEPHRVGLDPTRRTWIVPASAVAPAVSDTLEPACVVVLRRTGASTDASSLVPMHPADTVVSLMAQTMDAERFGADAVAVVARLAARCHCVELDIGSLQSAEAQVRALLDTAPPAVDTVELSVDTSQHHQSPVSPGTTSILVGDRVVVHHAPTGAVAALDDAGTAAWHALLGAPPSWFDPALLDSAGMATFLGQLTDAGFLIGDGGSPRRADRP